MAERNAPLAEIPVRLCCRQRHWGPICPDGLVMCCLCFERFALYELADADDGRKQDVCKDCAEMEAKAREVAGV